jgi:hypothetical protein
MSTTATKPKPAATKPGLDIIQCLNDPNLFAPHFKGESWDAWRVYLKALFALPMNDAELAVYQKHTGRVTVPTVPFKESALVCGRRAGKSRILSLIAVFLACFRDYKPFLAAGELATIGVICSDRKQARTIMRYISGALNNIPLLKPLIAEELSESITLSNIVIIEVGTASFRATRGYSYGAVLADEVSFWRDDGAANPAAEIVAAIRPGLSSIPGSMLIMASSPYAKSGLLYETYKRNYARDDARTLVFKGSSLEFNPSLDSDIVKEAYEDDAAAASAEYGGEFRSDIASFVDCSVIEAATMPGRRELPRIMSQRYHCFVDPSGGSSDSYTCCISHSEKHGTGPDAISRAVIDLIREYKPPFSPEAVTNEIAELVKQYGVNKVLGDRYAGEFPRELFKKKSIEYVLSDRPASDIFRDTLPLLNSGRVELLDSPVLCKQLIALERRTARSGKDSISHPQGGHDDVAVACCGAALLCTTGAASDTMARFIALAS